MGMAVTTLGLLVLATIRSNTDIWIIIGILVLQGIGFALFASPNTNAVMSSVERKDMELPPLPLEQCGWWGGP